MDQVEPVKIHPLDLYEILTEVNTDLVKIRLELLTLDGYPLIDYQDSIHEVNGVLYDQTVGVPHKTTRFDDQLRAIGLHPQHPEPTPPEGSDAA
jgi:hypothetical protein